MSGVDGWREEKQSAWLYRELASCEPDARIADLFRALADAAENQADRWRAQATSPPSFTPSMRARVTARLARLLGPGHIRPVLVAMKVRGVSVYSSGHPDPSGHRMPTSVSQVGRRHKAHGGGNLRAAVFGVNDGLVSNTSLIMGVAGAGAPADLVVTSGVAGLLAGALSMAAGEYVSMRSQRDMFEYQIGLERAELEQYPDAEAEELALIYQARGMDLDEARRITRELVRRHEVALDALAREELGLNPDDLGSPWGAALFSFFAFAAGALLPLAPFLLPGLSLRTGVATSAAVAVAALFGVGAALSLFTGREAWAGGLRMVAIGGGAGILTWLIGTVLGATLG